MCHCDTALQRRLRRQRLQRRRRQRRRRQVQPTRVGITAVRRRSGVWSGHVVVFAVFHDVVPAGCRQVVGARLTVNVGLDSCRAGTADAVEVGSLQYTVSET